MNRSEWAAVWVLWGVVVACGWVVERLSFELGTSDDGERVKTKWSWLFAAGVLRCAEAVGSWRRSS